MNKDDELLCDGVDVSGCPEVAVYEEVDKICCNAYLDGVCSGHRCSYKKMMEERKNAEDTYELFKGLLSSFNISVNEICSLSREVKELKEFLERILENVPDIPEHLLKELQGFLKKSEVHATPLGNEGSLLKELDMVNNNLKALDTFQKTLTNIYNKKFFEAGLEGKRLKLVHALTGDGRRYEKGRTCVIGEVSFDLSGYKNKVCLRPIFWNKREKDFSLNSNFFLPIDYFEECDFQERNYYEEL